MRIPGPDEEQPLAWSAILADTPVYSSDGKQVGVVGDVLGSQAEDIFHGIRVRAGTLKHDVLILAAQVREITNKRIGTALSAGEIQALPAYQEEESYHLGFGGLLGHRLGWQRDREEGPK